jgi:hypothetical protein
MAMRDLRPLAISGPRCSRCGVAADALLVLETGAVLTVCIRCADALLFEGREHDDGDDEHEGDNARRAR